MRNKPVVLFSQIWWFLNDICLYFKQISTMFDVTNEYVHNKRIRTIRVSFQSFDYTKCFSVKVSFSIEICLTMDKCFLFFFEGELKHEKSTTEKNIILLLLLCYFKWNIFFSSIDFINWTRNNQNLDAKTMLKILIPFKMENYLRLEYAANDIEWCSVAKINIFVLIFFLCLIHSA